jgi:predicted nicotinamide N-methyase
VVSNADAAADAPCATAVLRWGDAAADARAAALAPGAAAAASPLFDVCLGGDLIYDHDDAQLHLGQLIATVGNLLSRAPHAQFLLVRDLKPFAVM